MSAAMTRERQRERDILNKLWDIRVRVEADVWEMETRGDLTTLVTRRSTGEEVEICRFSRRALPDEIRLIAGIIPNMCLVLGMIERASARVRQLENEVRRLENAGRSKDYAANAAMLCQEPTFHRFLESKDGGEPIADNLAADARMKVLLAITSKKAINTDERARQAFLSLRSEFEAWKRVGV